MLRKSSDLAAGQVQGSVPVLIQQCQVSLGPVKEDGCTTQRDSFPLDTASARVDPNATHTHTHDHRGAPALTYGATVSLISSDHQGRTSTFVHRVYLCPVAKHQLKACHIFGKRSSMQWGPAGTARDIPVSRCVGTSRLTEQQTGKANASRPSLQS